MERGLPITGSHALWHSSIAAPGTGSLRLRCYFVALCLFSECLDCILTAAALSPPKTFHFVNAFNTNVSWFCLVCLCFSTNSYVHTCSLLMELAHGSLVLRYFWNWSGLGGMVILVFPFNSGSLVHFLLCYFYFSCT